MAKSEPSPSVISTLMGDWCCVKFLDVGSGCNAVCSQSVIIKFDLHRGSILTKSLKSKAKKRTDPETLILPGRRALKRHIY